MSKAIIVPDLAFTMHKGRGRNKAGGFGELKARLKYFQYRDDRNGHIPQEEGLERWHDRGLGQDYRSILNNCSRLASDRLLAWTWVVSPDPVLMAHVPEDQRQELVLSLTEEIVEAYYTARGVEVPEYSYVMHDRLTNGEDDSGERLQQLHTHVVLPTTVPTVEGARDTFDNRANKGHFKLLQAISTEKFEAALDYYVGPEWRLTRSEQALVPDEQAVQIMEPTLDETSELDQWFGPRSLDIS